MPEIVGLHPDEERLIRMIREHRTIRRCELTIELRFGRVHCIMSLMTEQLPQDGKSAGRLQE